MSKVILVCNEEARCWTALFFRTKGMPEAQEVPLPWHWTAARDNVVADMRKRFPGISVWYRELGTVMAAW